MGAAIAASIFALLSASAQHDLQRCGVNETGLEQLVALPLSEFDQDVQRGWRPISARKGCDRAAAEVLTAYMLYSRPSAPDNLKSLRWHAGQVLADAGESARAIAFFQGSYEPTPKDGSPNAWNLYVDGTIAFLRKDRATLDKATTALAAIPVSEETKAERRAIMAEQRKANPGVTINYPKGFVDDPPNLSVLKGFQRSFDKPYAEAYGGHCEG
ncbi:MAG: hypothetical protein WAW96_06755 [Alphaproteobacteria bacterium]